jgi:hypothetical protein
MDSARNIPARQSLLLCWQQSASAARAMRWQPVMRSVRDPSPRPASRSARAVLWRSATSMRLVRWRRVGDRSLPILRNCDDTAYAEFILRKVCFWHGGPEIRRRVLARDISLVQVERAIALGCSRKYMSLLNGTDSGCDRQLPLFSRPDRGGRGSGDSSRLLGIPGSETETP